jgi:hypothetical protein
MMFLNCVFNISYNGIAAITRDGSGLKKLMSVVVTCSDMPDSNASIEVLIGDVSMNDLAVHKRKYEKSFN